MVVCLPHSRCPITGMLLRTRTAALLCEPHTTSQQVSAAEILTHSSVGLITSLKAPVGFGGRSYLSSTWHHFYDLAYNPWQHRHNCVSEEGAWEGLSVGAPVLGRSGKKVPIGSFSFHLASSLTQDLDQRFPSVREPPNHLESC